MNSRFRVILSDFDEGQSLVITHDGKEIGFYTDGGEPEDQLFCRDWDWVPGEIERAYQLGLSDGRSETINN